MTTHQLLERMLAGAREARFALHQVATDAEETPIPGWLATEICRIGLAVTHLEAQLALEVDSI